MSSLLILSSNTGEGHNSAAGAIRLAARTAGLETTVRKPLEESGAVNRALGNFYNALLTRRPQWMTAYLWVINRVGPNQREFLYRRERKFIGRFLASTKPDVLLSVHPMLNHFIQRFIKDERLGIPCYTFLTDPFPPFWRGWASPYVDRYLVVRNEAAEALAALGVERRQIEIVPMPVRPQFTAATMSDIQGFRREFNLGEGSTILVNGGARGGGPIADIIRAVRRASPEANILVICGRNDSLYRRLQRTADARTRVFGFVADIPRFVAASDLALTKPGAMSSYEALACGVPPVLLGILALMPQESGMFAAAKRYGFGYAVDTLDDLEGIIRVGPEDWNRKREAIPHFYKRSSGAELIERILPTHARV
jgi:UDP-N-acetylglucosamine:LPS N-acetylglucosamine transferase